MTSSGLRSSFGKLARRVAPNVGAIVATTSEDLVLTFDDGPDPRETVRVLEVLSAHSATATFFVLLTRTRANPSVLQEIIDAGHEIGLHGPDHQALSDFSYRAATARTVAARDELEEAVGSPVRWFRPPYGSQSATSFLASRRAGLTPVLWSATTWDWKDVSNQERLAKASQGARPGAILLAHDGAADASDHADTIENPQCDRPELIGQVLEAIAPSEMKVRSLGEVLASAKALRTPRLTTRKPDGAATSP